jgi:FkbM family methyltransferase
MHVNTRLLFLDLLRDLRIETVCDVGSMDASDALAFRARLPRARVIAWEPNPNNFRRISADPRVAAANIELIAAAATERDGDAPFYLVPADCGEPNEQRGKSSLYRREGPDQGLTKISVPTRRLDGVLKSSVGTSRRIALWIDAEGKAFEVLEGAREVAGQVHLVHVEVESTACIGTNQRLYPEVREWLERFDFEELATDHPQTTPQFNAIYLRRGQAPAILRRIRSRVHRARLRRQLVEAVQKRCPGCAARLAALRRRLFDR